MAAGSASTPLPAISPASRMAALTTPRPDPGLDPVPGHSRSKV